MDAFLIGVASALAASATISIVVVLKGRGWKSVTSLRTRSRHASQLRAQGVRDVFWSRAHYAGQDVATLPNLLRLRADSSVTYVGYWLAYGEDNDLEDVFRGVIQRRGQVCLSLLAADMPRPLLEAYALFLRMSPSELEARLTHAWARWRKFGINLGEEERRSYRLMSHSRFIGCSAFLFNEPYREGSTLWIDCKIAGLGRGASYTFDLRYSDRDGSLFQRYTRFVEGVLLASVVDLP